MTGTLVKRKLSKGEVYYTAIYYYDEEGKRHQMREATGLLVKGNKTRAEELLRKRLTEAEAEGNRKKEAKAEGNRKKEAKASGNVQLFSNWIRKWLQEAKRRVENNTWRQYDDISRTHILPYFDDMGIELEGISREVLQAYVDDKKKRAKGR